MSEFFAWLEGTGLATWTRESTSIWAYPTILTLHTIGLGIVVGGIAVVNLRLLGFAPRIPVPSLRPLFRVIWWAFALNAVTGILLFMSDATTKSHQRVFYVKLTLIALALWTTTSTRKIVGGASDAAPASPLPPRAGRVALVSLVLWTGAIVAGRLMAYL